MSYDTEVLADTPAGYWKLQDTSGTTAVDSSGNGRNGTYNGTVSTHYALNQTGIIPSESSSPAVEWRMNGGTSSHGVSSTQYGSPGSVSVAYGAWMDALATSKTFTAEAWIKTSANFIQSSPILISRRKGGGRLQFALLCSANGSSNANAWGYFTENSAVFSGADGFALGTGVGASDASAPFSLAGNPSGLHTVNCYDTAAHHVGLVMTTSTLRAFADGMLATQYLSDLSTFTIQSNTTDPLVINGITDVPANASFGFIGKMQKAAIYASALSAARIAAHYTAGAAKIAFLNQQWALQAAQAMDLSAGASVTDTTAFILAARMDLSGSITASTDILEALRMGMALSASASAVTLMGVNQRLGVAFMDAVSISDSVASSKFMTMSLHNIAGLGSALGMTGRLGMSLSDVITAGIVIKAGEDTYNGWIVNPNLMASAGLEGMQFNSFTKHKGRYYGIGAGGIYELGGPNDNGANIDAFVGLPKLNFGTANKKRVPYAYIGAAGDKMVLRVVVDSTTYTYVADNATTGMGEQRITTGKGLKGNYWQFELVNANGADFDIDNIKFMPMVLERRRGE